MFPAAARMIDGAIGGTTHRHDERVQERAAQYGAATLTCRELVELIAGPTAAAAFTTWRELLKAPAEPTAENAKLRAAIAEIPRRIAAELAANDSTQFGTPDKAYKHMVPFCAGLEVEKLWTLCLDRKNRLMRMVESTSGTATASLMHPREVFREAIRAGASAVIVVHNHPSGDPAPSRADITVTRQIREAAKVVGIDLLDHIVIGEPGRDPLGFGYYSFNEAGLI
jgi:DNA repair protein RadC